MAGSDMIRRKLATEVVVPILNERMKRRKVAIRVVEKAIMPREKREQKKPAAMNINADRASTAA